MKYFNVTIFLMLSITPLSYAVESKNPFFGLQHLVGTWKLVHAEHKYEKDFRLVYRLVSKNSALVEVYGDPQKQTTETIFHADGTALLATHYCAQGNQPRLKAISSKGDKVVEFAFMDITNLKDKKDAHMVRMKFHFIDKNHFEKAETYLVNGKEETSVMSLTRIN